MIKTKKDLQRYLEMDKVALGITKKHPSFFGDWIWKFEIALRKHEYYLNTKKNRLLELFWRRQHFQLGIKLGFTIPCNTMGGASNQSLWINCD